MTRPRLSRFGPRPRRGTVRLTAVCSECNGIIYRFPIPGAPWYHDDSGDDRHDEGGPW